MARITPDDPDLKRYMLRADPNLCSFYIKSEPVTTSSHDDFYI
jgi:hypothetical protein